MGRGAPLDGSRISFILSAGRTGTTFLASVCPALTPDLVYVQEPPRSRTTFMLANAATAGLIARDRAEGLFMRRRTRLLAGDARSSYVEINPFLAPLAPRLPDLVDPLRVVHMVRDPRSWVPSMANFKAWGWRRTVIDWVPFAQTVHPAARATWGRLDDIRRYAWRWRLANEQIAACAERCRDYVVVRYEDLFSGNPASRSRALGSILSTLRADARFDDAAVPWDTTVNPSTKLELEAWERWSDDDRRDVAAIVEPLMARFGYEWTAAPQARRRSAT